MSLEELIRNREVWQKKTILRQVYQNEFFPLLAKYRVDGKHTLEVGGGPGFFKAFSPEVISSDISVCSWLDLSANGEYLPFETGKIDNVIVLDMLHHLGDPLKFLTEAERVLRKGGRIVMIEPWVTPFSYLIMRFFIPEGIDFSWKPGDVMVPLDKAIEKKPFDANQAVPTLLFTKYKADLAQIFPRMKVIKVERFALFAYLLCMGFREISLLPASLYHLVQKFERHTKPLWSRLGAIKGLVVMEKI